MSERIVAQNTLCRPDPAGPISGHEPVFVRTGGIVPDGYMCDPRNLLGYEPGPGEGRRNGSRIRTIGPADAQTLFAAQGRGSPQPCGGDGL